MLVLVILNWVVLIMVCGLFSLIRLCVVIDLLEFDLLMSVMYLLVCMVRLSGLMMGWVFCGL